MDPVQIPTIVQHMPEVLEHASSSVSATSSDFLHLVLPKFNTFIQITFGNSSSTHWFTDIGIGFLNVAKAIGNLLLTIFESITSGIKWILSILH